MEELLNIVSDKTKFIAKFLWMEVQEFPTITSYLAKFNREGKELDDFSFPFGYENEPFYRSEFEKASYYIDGDTLKEESDRNKIKMVTIKEKVQQKLQEDYNNLNFFNKLFGGEESKQRYYVK